MMFSIKKSSSPLKGCPDHAEILIPHQESQILEITEPYRGVPFVLASGTFLTNCPRSNEKS